MVPATPSNFLQVDRSGPQFSIHPTIQLNVFSVLSVVRADKSARLRAELVLEVAPGESREYWKYHAPGKLVKQIKAVSWINNEKATMLFNLKAEA